MRIADYHMVTYRAGEWGYSAGRARGQLAVWHDSKLYLYRQPPASLYSRGEVRHAIRDAWEQSSNMRANLRGRWPNYTVEMVG